jgi:hypothetical protein
MTVPLSENERRQLQEIEHDLLANDPHLALSLSGRRWRRPARAVIAPAGVIGAILAMFFGLQLKHAGGILLADAGFLLLVLSTFSLGEYMQPRLRGRRRRTITTSVDAPPDSF